MEARFAGSQRVGDRRRRRLAAGADDCIDHLATDEGVPTDAQEQPALASPAGGFRAVDAPHTDAPSTDPSLLPSPQSLHFPIARIVPVAVWKYLVGGLLGLAVSSGLVVAGHYSPQLETIAGAGIADLLKLPNGRLAQWFSSGLLLLCAQLSLLTWWARSRSLQDFDGRYWVWIRTAGIWLAVSGCLSTDAHHIVLSALDMFRPGLSRMQANLCWMGPAAIVGMLLVSALAREMRGCRASRTLLFMSCGLHLLAGAWHLKFETVLSPAARAIVVSMGLLAGQVALFVSMWLHARHVLHFSADPAPKPTRKWRIPRPHFRLLPSRWTEARTARRNARQQISTTPEPSATPKARRKNPVEAPAAESPAPTRTESAPNAPATPAGDRPGKPRIRIDSRHLEKSRQTTDESDSRADADAGTASQSDGLDDGPGNTVEPASDPIDRRKASQGQPPNTASVRFAEDAPTSQPEPSEPDEPQDEEPDGGQQKPDLRGLSKKQRRRLMQELRDRERASHR